MTASKEWVANRILKLFPNLISSLGSYGIPHNGEQLFFDATRPVIDGVLGEGL